MLRYECRALRKQRDLRLDEVIHLGDLSLHLIVQFEKAGRGLDIADIDPHGRNNVLVPLSSSESGLWRIGRTKGGKKWRGLRGGEPCGGASRLVD